MREGPLDQASDLDRLRALEAECDRAVRVRIQRMLDETNYRPSRFMQMVTELGGAGAIRALLAGDLAPEELHEGLIRLWEEDRLDLSMEHLVAYEPRWAPLFTDLERARARRRLDDLGLSGAEPVETSPQIARNRVSCASESGSKRPGAWRRPAPLYPNRHDYRVFAPELDFQNAGRSGGLLPSVYEWFPGSVAATMTLDPRIAELARQGLRPVLEERLEQLRESLGVILGDLTHRGIGRGGAAADAVKKRCAREVAQAAEIAWRNLWRVVSSLGMTSAPAEELKDDVRRQLEEFLATVRGIMDEWVIRVAGRELVPDANRALQEAIRRAEAKVDFEIGLFLYAARAASEVRVPTAAATTVNIYSPVGAVQTGPNASATIVQNLGQDERQQLLTALRTLRDSVSEPREEVAFDRQEIIEMAIAAQAELEKPRPNGSMLTSLLSGIATTIQTAGALQPAYAALKAAAAAVGITLP